MMMKKHTTKLRTNDIEKIVDRLSKLSDSSEDKKQLQLLKQHAIDGINLKDWVKRVIPGTSLATAIEKWLINFNPTFNKPLGEQIPKEETRNVVAAWMSFTIYRTIVAVSLSSIITIVTIFFLYLQIKKQDELIEFQRDISKQDKKMSYIQILYDEVCSTIEKEVDNKKHKEEVCKNKHNQYTRREALTSFLKITKNINSINLEGALLSDLDMRELNLSKSNLKTADLRNVEFINTNLEQANLIGANVKNTNFQGANIDGAVLFKAQNLTCTQLKFAKNWQNSYRDVELKCGAPLPLLEGNTVNLAKYYKQILYDKVCRIVEKKLHNEKFKEEVCQSEHDKFTRTDALTSLLKIKNTSAINLEGAFLTDLDMRELNLSESKFLASDLRNVKFINTNLARANLIRANVENTNFQGANIDGAKLLGAQNLTCKQLKSAKNWENSYRDAEMKCGAKQPMLKPSVLDLIKSI